MSDDYIQLLLGANYRIFLENAINDLFKENEHIKNFFLSMVDIYVELYKEAYDSVKANPAEYLAQAADGYKRVTVKYQRDVDSAIKEYEKENAVLREKLSKDLGVVEKGYNDSIKEITDSRKILEGYLIKPKTKTKKRKKHN